MCVHLGERERERERERESQRGRDRDRQSEIETWREANRDTEHRGSNIFF